MLLGKLAASSLGSSFSGRGVIRAGQICKCCFIL